MNRRNFLHGSGALAGLSTMTALTGLTSLTGCHRDPKPDKNGLIPISLQADWYPQPEQGGYFNAVVQGFYKDVGLDVKILPLPAYGSGLQMIANGSTTFCMSASDAILETVSHGIPFVGVMATMQHDPQAVMVHKESPVHTFADLEGHAIAAQTGATWIRYIASKYNLKNVREIPSTHSIANFLADPNYIQQIFITSEPYFVTKAGSDFRTMLISSAGYDPYRAVFTIRDFVDRHPEIVEKFVRASIQGWREYVRYPGPANALILKLNPAQNPDKMAYSVKALIDGGFITGGDPTGAEVGKMTAARWASNYEQLRSLNVIKNPIDPTTAYTLQFLPK